LTADDCTAFLVPDSRTADGHGFFGQTWDMHDDSTEFVILLRGKPDDGPGYLAFSITGCLGMIGMNDAGIAIGINNLLGGDGQVGVTWPFVVRKALQQTEIDAALACITEAKLAGAHNYMIFDAHGRGYNVEAMSTHCASDLSWTENRLSTPTTAWYRPPSSAPARGLRPPRRPARPG
jgi:isopenicillin-N N-acyltransferase-like protein